MAKTLGVSRQHLQAVETGKSTVSVERAIRWARRLGYVDELLAELALQAEVSAAGLKRRVKLEAVA
jgi:DNA-binding XRE family transcriptional regulator